MAKAIFGEYSAFETPGGIRFMRGNKLTGEKSVPPEVAAFLRDKLGKALAPEPVPETPKFPRPSPEEQARLRAESLQVKPELQVEEPLTATDFDVPEVPPDLGIVSTEVPTTTAETFPEPTPRPLEPIQLQEHPTEKAVRETKEEVSSFLEEVSIHTASIDDMVQALYSRFGIYTVWLKQLPNGDEINPLTGEGFTKYHLGIAYQAAIRAQSRGLLDLDPASNRKMIDEGRAASDNVRDSFVPQAVSIRENRQANTYDYRTSPVGTRDVPTTEIVHETDEQGQVHAVQRTINGEPSETGKKNGAGVSFDRDEDEPLVQPNFSGKPIIRPDW